MYVYEFIRITVIFGMADIVLSAMNSLEKRDFIRSNPSVFTYEIVFNIISIKELYS
jgi:hypothetical protein